MARRELTTPEAKRGRSSRVKGAVGERELAKEFTRLFGVEAHRGCQHAGGTDSPDIKVDIPNLHVECKRVENFNLYKALDQSIKDAGEELPVVCHRRNNRDWVICLRLDDVRRFLQIMKEAGIE